MFLLHHERYSIASAFLSASSFSFVFATIEVLFFVPPKSIETSPRQKGRDRGEENVDEIPHIRRKKNKEHTKYTIQSIQNTT